MSGNSNTMTVHDAGQTVSAWPGRPAVVATLLTGMAIAYLTPFDANVAMVAGGSGIARAAVTAILVLLGTWFAQRVGLRFEGHGSHSPALVGATGALAVAAYVVVLDCLLFRAVLPANYVEFLQAPLAERYAYFMLRAFNENIVYRLFAFSGFMWLATLTWGRNRVPGIVIAGCMVAAQILNIWFNVVSLSGPPSVAMLGYDLLRYVVPGVVWAILFRRNGFMVAEIASVGCHVFLQPAFGALI